MVGCEPAPRESEPFDIKAVARPRSPELPAMFFGAATLTAGHGGIARVSRMVARTLIDAGADLQITSLAESGAFDLHGGHITACGGSRLEFATRTHLAALGGRVCLYDTLGLSRAHPRLPRLGGPFAVWAHGIEAFEDMRRDRKRALHRASKVITNSNYTLEKHQNLHGPLKDASVCWLATEHDDPPDSPAAFDGPPTVLIIGRLDAAEHWKGHNELIACWPRVVDAVPDARLEIAGGGTGLERVQALCRSSRAADRIEVLGFVPEERIEALFRRAHVFAMPSRQEGFGITYIEAMRFGLPVIASVHDAGAEVNVDGETGYNVDLDRPEELGDRLIELLRDTDKARELGRAGAERWAAHFRYSNFAERFLGIWREFIETKVSNQR